MSAALDPCQGLCPWYLVVDRSAVSDGQPKRQQDPRFRVGKCLTRFGSTEPNTAWRPQPKVADCSAIERLDRRAVRDVRAMRACLEIRH